MIVRLLVGLTVLAAATLASANPVPVGSPGSTILPLSGSAQVTPSDAVQLVEETIEISDDAVVSIPAFSPREKDLQLDAVSFSCRYRLRNRTKTDIEIQVGFPVVTYGYNAGGSNGGVVDFAVTANGKPLEAKLTDVAMPHLVARSDLTPQLLNQLLKSKDAKEVPAAPEFFDLTPEAFKKVTKSNEDFAPIQQTLTWYSFPVKFRAGADVGLAINYNSVLPMHPVRFGYILRTGRFWRDNVESITLSFLPKKTPKRSYTATPAGKFTQSPDGRLTLKLRATKPDFDVMFERKD